MRLLPEFGLAWFGGWLLLVVYAIAFGTTVLSLSSETRHKLYDRSGWTRQQLTLTTIGKLVGVAYMVLIAASKLRVGEPVFVVGMVLYALGLVGVVVALLDYERMPEGEPATKGLYRVSRNPQWLMLVLAFLGGALAVGSWLVLLVLAVDVVLFHFRILAEERSCLALYGEPYAEYMRRVPRYLLV